MINKAAIKEPVPAKPGPALAGTTIHSIVEATRALLATRGYEALSMRDVANGAGITAAAIYRHFPNKDALVDFVVNDTLREFDFILRWPQMEDAEKREKYSKYASSEGTLMPLA